MLKKRKGITLIALIITIIILLILAGVSIATLTNSGLFEKAKQAKEKSEQAKLDEQEKLQSYIDAIGGKQLPENTPETEAGTEVKLKDGWGTQNVNYIRTSNGAEVTELQTVATVYAISVGNGETVPVPKDFYYVGGNLASGVVISDNPADRNKYAGKTTVGIDLQGNQFVWIPCKTNNYKKTNLWNGTAFQDSNWDTTVSKSEIIQIEKYGGYYVARYEAGLDTTKAHISETSYSVPLHDNETARVQSKAGLVPWTWVSYNTSKARAEEMYNTNYVNSGLITGAQWDVMINTIADKTGVSLTDSTWGNHDNTSITYTGPAATFNENTIGLGVFTGSGGTTNSSTANGSKLLLYTGASAQCMKYNLYDVAGNVWEFTEETSYYGGNTATEHRVIRGGSNCEISSSYPVCYRGGTTQTSGFSHNVGFRVVLYLK